MSKVLVSSVAAAHLMVTAVSPANAFHGVGLHDHDLMTPPIFNCHFTVPSRPGLSRTPLIVPDWAT
jgi:hypothetical protein